MITIIISNIIHYFAMITLFLTHENTQASNSYLQLGIQSEKTKYYLHGIKTMIPFRWLYDY